MITTKVVNVLKDEVLKMPIEEGKCLIDTMTNYVKDHLVVTSNYPPIPYIIKDIKWCEEKYQYCYKAEVTIKHPDWFMKPPKLSVVVKSDRNSYDTNTVLRYTDTRRVIV